MEEIIDYLVGANARLTKTLGADLSGVYAYGSLINNSGHGFSTECSDVDLLVTTPLADARLRTEFLVKLKTAILTIERGLRRYLPGRGYLPIANVSVVTKFELDEGIHMERNATNVYARQTFFSLASADAELCQIGGPLSEDLVKMIGFPAWAILAAAQGFRSQFVTPGAGMEAETEDFDDPVFALPKDLVRSAYFLYCFVKREDPSMIVEDDIAIGLTEMCRLLEKEKQADKQANELLKLIRFHRPNGGGKGARQPVRSHDLLFLWELLSVETEKALAEIRRDSGKDVFKRAADIVTLELSRLGATTLEVIDMAIAIDNRKDLLQEPDGFLPVEAKPHKEIDFYEFAEIDKEHLTRLAVEWPKDIEDYLRGRLDEGSGDSTCKVGFAGLFYSQTGNKSQQPVKLRVRPLSYWVTQQFNKEMAAQPNNAVLRNLRTKYGTKLFKATEDFLCDCPSSLYLEMAVVTRDNYVLKLAKTPKHSVFGKLRGEPVFTCGIEHGFSWREHIKTIGSKLQLNVQQALADGLQEELAVQLSEVAAWSVSALAIQYTHLNAALLGAVRLNLTRGDLIDRIKLPSRFFEKLDFLSVPDAILAIESDKGTGKWHQTALMRINLIANL